MSFVDFVVTHLHGHQPIVHHDLLGEAVFCLVRPSGGQVELSYSQVCTDSGLVLVAEPLVHILVHKGGLPDSTAINRPKAFT